MRKMGPNIDEMSLTEDMLVFAFTFESDATLLGSFKFANIPRFHIGNTWR